jgi:hypothetical protein
MEIGTVSQKSCEKLENSLSHYEIGSLFFSFSGDSASFRRIEDVSAGCRNISITPTMPVVGLASDPHNILSLCL